MPPNSLLISVICTAATHSLAIGSSLTARGAMYIYIYIYTCIVCSRGAAPLAYYHYTLLTVTFVSNIGARQHTADISNLAYMNSMYKILRVMDQIVVCATARVHNHYGSHGQSCSLWTGRTRATNHMWTHSRYEQNTAYTAEWESVARRVIDLDHVSVTIGKSVSTSFTLRCLLQINKVWSSESCENMRPFNAENVSKNVT